MPKMTVEEASADIQKHIEDPGPYSHNIISFKLRTVARDFGFDVANKMVDDLELDSKFGIGRIEHGTDN